jgi:hypothetical protein
MPSLNFFVFCVGKPFYFDLLNSLFISLLCVANVVFFFNKYSSYRIIFPREALRWKARKGGSRWGRGGKKASV